MKRLTYIHKVNRYRSPFLKCNETYKEEIDGELRDLYVF